MSLAERTGGEGRGLGQATAPRRSALFTVDVELLSGEAVLTLRGELDLWTRQLLVDELARVDETIGRIVLDLGEVTFIDASSLSVIHRSRIRAAMRGTDLVLRSPSPHILKLLALTGLCEGAVEESRPTRVAV